MSNSLFTFHLTPYNTEHFLPQTAKALEKRMDLLSQKRYPRLWRATDKLNSTSQGRTRSKKRVKFLSILYLLLGIFLLIPGLAKPQELLIPLVIGAIGVGYGILGLLGSREGQKKRFEKAAKTLLAGKDTFSAKQRLTVSFSEIGMTLPGAEEQRQFVPYHDFECAIETEDLFLLVHNKRVTLLQKIDLKKGTLSDFRAFLSEFGVNYSQISG